MRTLLFGAAMPTPRLLDILPIGRCTPAPFIEPLCRCAGLPKSGRAFTPALTPALPRMPEGGETRLTTGRVKLRGGGAAALIPAFGPSIAVLVGLTSSECTGVTRLSWFGEMRIALRATGCEFIRVCRETAVKPLGACMFA